MGRVPTRRGEWLIVVAAVAGGALFFASLGRLWPLAGIPLVVDPVALETTAREYLSGRGFDTTGYVFEHRLAVDGAALEYVERELGRERAQHWIAEGFTLYDHRVMFKKPGSRITFTVRVHPGRGVIDWRRSTEDDEAGASLDVDAARPLALEALVDGLGLDPSAFEERSASSVDRPHRRDHLFGFERSLSDDPELRERVEVTVAGDRVVAALRSLVVPAAAERAARAAEAPGRAMEAVGFLLLGVAAVAAFIVFIRRLRGNSVELGPASIWPVAVFVCLLTTFSLERSTLFLFWEPLWPRWVSGLQYLMYRATDLAWLVVVLLAVVGAGAALDREIGAGRRLSLWSLGRGRIGDPAVALASARGFLIGLLCGGVMAGSVLLLQRFAGASSGIQPRGFFFYTLNSSAPALTSLLFFFGVALGEELGYRFFMGSWLLSWGRGKWLAIVLPAMIYGLTHTRLEFLPPAEPFWARALVMTLVGCVWGWAFLRYDALTVVLSHFSADLFIFNWPRLASGDAGVAAASLATMVVPLLPAAVWALRRVASRSQLERR